MRVKFWTSSLSFKSLWWVSGVSQAGGCSYFNASLWRSLFSRDPAADTSQAQENLSLRNNLGKQEALRGNCGQGGVLARHVLWQSHLRFMLVWQLSPFLTFTSSSWSWPCQPWCQQFCGSFRGVSGGFVGGVAAAWSDCVLCSSRWGAPTLSLPHCAHQCAPCWRTFGWLYFGGVCGYFRMTVLWGPQEAGALVAPLSS